MHARLARHDAGVVGKGEEQIARITNDKCKSGLEVSDCGHPRAGLVSVYFPLSLLIPDDRLPI